ncbi:MAG: hypothetical protein LBT53_06330 [Puniceicoccales bacterium]|jgi:hypothetical protein|nr:hypothetical protein [Puniceicoccales bacterium]
MTAAATADSFATTPTAPHIHGQPAANVVSADVRQHYPDTCAIKSQELVLREFGLPVTEDQLRSEATAHGWYSPGAGTPASALGNLLELHGVPVTRYEHANIYNLVNELAQGHKVLIGVDSGELWNNGYWERMEDRLVGERADHALLVSGVDTTDPANVKVIVTDPGNGDYCKEYTLPQFVDAWHDSNCYMVSTAIPLPDIFAPFPEGTTHIPMIGDFTYEHFFDTNAFVLDHDHATTTDLTTAPDLASAISDFSAPHLDDLTPDAPYSSNIETAGTLASTLADPEDLFHA